MNKEEEAENTYDHTHSAVTQGKRNVKGCRWPTASTLKLVKGEKTDKATASKEASGDPQTQC